MAKEVEKAAKNDAQTRRRLIRPRCNIVGDSDKVVLTLEMPGVKKDDLHINIENNELRVSGERSTIGDVKYYIRERIVGDYATTYTLDETIDQDRVEAELKDGILTLTLHVKEAVKPRKIEVQAS